MQLRDRYREFDAKGAAIAAIGMGTPEVAAHFKNEYEIPFLLLVDHDKRTYRMLEMGRGSITDIAGPRVWVSGAKGLLRGHGVAVAKQDVFQLGGVAVVYPGGDVRKVHRAATSADNPPVDDLLAAL